ncbi:uncharacterized protein LOC107844098 isoform X1 [Capsicum annuum]|uniref:uncharacterized protein LOC107844098 isoform X1 n=2 Tax=Capsicum annuum TaxID=4072 RepID=UPI001FB16429|nr:uncharacterized protein LOC107844098 isoform X1 [Capsicum annuum]
MKKFVVEFLKLKYFVKCCGHKSQCSSSKNQRKILSNAAKIPEMDSIPVLVKHSGRWTYEKNCEDYVTDAILLSTTSSFIELHDVLASHLNVDLTNKRILMEYQITGNIGKIQIHNDMGLKVFMLEKKDIQDMNYLPLYVSILEKVVGRNFASSSVCLAERSACCNNVQAVLSAYNEGSLVVSKETTSLDVFEMDMVEMIISDPHHNFNCNSNLSVIQILIYNYNQ